MLILIGIASLISVLALISAGYFNWYVVKKERGTSKMVELQRHIREGAFTFMSEEAYVMGITMLVIGLVLWKLFYWQVATAFWIGSILSMLAGFIGMNAATHSNARVTNAAQHSLKSALDVAFSGGSVMGLSVAGLSLGGLILVIWLFRALFDPANLAIHSKSLPLISSILGRDLNFIKAALIVSAYSMGASLVALFDRVGGGIYTKAADIGADLVGKVEAGIPEDDPRNPGVIADNVGDNVGDVGGLGADLLESFVGAIISVMVIMLYIYVGRDNPTIHALISQLGIRGGLNEPNFWWIILLPALIVGGGIISSLIGILYIRLSRGKGMQRILMNGTRLSALLTVGTTLLIVWLSPANLRCFYSIVMGLTAGILIGFLSEYYTSSRYQPVKDIAQRNVSGPAIGVLQGMAVGMISTLWPVLIIAAATIGAYQFAGLIGVAFAALGMLSFVGMTVSVDTYGPIADNAGGIAQMAGLNPRVREATDSLDAIGNTTAAIGKGFAIGSATFAALGLIAAYMWSAASKAAEIDIPTIFLVSPNPEIGGFVIAGLIIGAMIPYAFSSLLIKGVSSTADIMITEIRRQFKEIPGILKGNATPDYKRCISITSAGGLKKMILPSLLAVVMPLVIGLVLGRYALVGFLMGGLLSSIQLAIYCANTGGALDNAKKYIEEGHHGGKGSEAHRAGVIGDTVGDPLKDTVGPSLDILIKLMSVISLVFASIFPTKPIFF